MLRPRRLKRHAIEQTLVWPWGQCVLKLSVRQNAVCKRVLENKMAIPNLFLKIKSFKKLETATYCSESPNYS